MNANLAAYVDDVYAELKDDLPDLSEFELKTLILDKIRNRAEAQANELLAVHFLTETVKALAVLAQSQQL